MKIRGTAHHIAEKYLQLARDAQGSGDPVTAENHFQHAEHYLRMIAAAQEQFRAQNPYYQAPPAPGEIRDEAFEGDEDDGGQPGQGQPVQGQPPQGQPNFGNQQQQNFNNPQNYNNNQQPSYPPRETAAALRRPAAEFELSGPRRSISRSSTSLIARRRSNSSRRSRLPRASDVERLPSFITGSQPQQNAQSAGTNGYDNQGGDRYPASPPAASSRPGWPGGRDRICRTCRRISTATTAPTSRATARGDREI